MYPLAHSQLGVAKIHDLALSRALLSSGEEKQGSCRPYHFLEPLRPPPSLPCIPTGEGGHSYFLRVTGLVGLHLLPITTLSLQLGLLCTALPS
jgi:hypothetical protein